MTDFYLLPYYFMNSKLLEGRDHTVPLTLHLTAPSTDMGNLQSIYYTILAEQLVLRVLQIPQDNLKNSSSPHEPARVETGNRPMGDRGRWLQHTGEVV